MKVKFDMSALNNAGLSAPPDVFITFAAAASDMVYGPGTSVEETINFSGNILTIEVPSDGGTPDSKSFGTSRAYNLQDIAKNGLVLNSATSLVGFISYGSAAGIELLPENSQPNYLDSETPRYSIFEISYDGTSGGADITNISQYGGSIKLAFLSGETVQSEIGNTLDTASMFAALAAAAGYQSSAVFLSPDGYYRRVLGTNVFPVGSTQNPYPTYNAYLQSLFASKGCGSIAQELTNLAPGQKPGGLGSAGFESTGAATNVSPNTIYNLDYHFTAVVTQVTSPDPGNNDPNGTYSVVLSGHVNATLAGTGGISSHRYDNLSVNIAADDLAGGNLYMTNFIYEASPTAAGTNVTSSGWDDLNNDFGEANANAAALLKVAGDFAEGMTCGFPGSTTPSTSSPKKDLGDLISYEWWLNPLLAYEPAQPLEPYYSAYGNVVSANSGGINGVAFNRGGVYGSPYDDRFGLNLISPNADTDTMRITLLADGNLTPIPPSPIV